MLVNPRDMASCVVNQYFMVGTTTYNKRSSRTPNRQLYSFINP